MSSATKEKLKQPKAVDIHVGKRIRLQRNMKKMSQEKLGDALGITFQQIQKYEKGTNRVGASRLQAISDVLEAPVAFFFDGGPSEGSANKETNQSDTVLDFVSTRQGLELNRSFLKIKDNKVRERAVQLIKAMADSEI